MLGVRKFCTLFLLFAVGAGGLILVHSRSRAQDMNSTLVIGSSKLGIAIESGDLQLTQPQLMHWVQSAADAVATYYGRFPVPHAHLRIIPAGGSGIRHGQTFGFDGGLIKIRVGAQTTPDELASDWMLTHEMIHLSFPSMADEHHWIEEGIAVYVEPIARIQAGQMSAERMWADLVRDMPKGQPDDGDRGLDHTHTWGRTYWGGALFCFVADVRIRKQTQNKKGLQDALRGILESGGDITHDWDLQETLKVGDTATSTNVLSALYAEMKDKPVTVDLDAMWKDLGIAPDGKSVRLLDSATSASIRRAITAAPAQTHASLRSVAAGRTLAK